MTNQTLGRGKVYFSRFKEGTQDPEGYRYIGNTPALSLNIQNDTLDHYSSDSGIREKDQSIILQTNATGSLTCDDINADNLALFFFGSSSILSQTSGTSVSETLSDVIPGLMYPLGVSDANPTGVREVSNVVVANGATTYDVDDDYTVDAVLGQITIVVGGTITSGTDLTVTYDRAAKSREQVISGTSEVEGALKFIADNPAGPNRDYTMPWVKMSPNGDFNLKAEQDWLQLPLNLEILKRSNRERIYLDGRAYTAT